MLTKEDFKAFPKISRLARNMIITEKLDGTNAQIAITAMGEVFAGSRNRWISVDDDNYGFARWVEGNKGELLKLGPGIHYGEWWGNGIQRSYGLKEKRFSLFNVARWSANESRPECCHVVPILSQHKFCTELANEVLDTLKKNGSYAAPGFMDPEGIVIYHTASQNLYKKTIEKDEEPKSGNN